MTESNIYVAVNSRVKLFLIMTWNRKFLPVKPELEMTVNSNSMIHFVEKEFGNNCSVWEGIYIKLLSIQMCTGRK